MRQRREARAEERKKYTNVCVVPKRGGREKEDASAAREAGDGGYNTSLHAGFIPFRGMTKFGYGFFVVPDGQRLPAGAELCLASSSFCTSVIRMGPCAEEAGSILGDLASWF